MNITIVFAQKNDGPDEDQGFWCVVRKLEARQYWVTKPLVSIGVGFTAPRSW